MNYIKQYRRLRVIAWALRIHVRWYERNAVVSRRIADFVNALPVGPARPPRARPLPNFWRNP